MPPSIRGGLPPLAWYGFVVRAALFTMLVVAVGEEPGWRGWMLPEVQKRYSPLVSSILVGVTWGFWHLPLFMNGAYPGSPVDIIEYLFTGPMFALLLTWLYNRTAGNLLLALVLHTAANNTGRMLPSTGTFSVLLLLFIVVVVCADRMWRRPRRGTRYASSPAWT
jgi:membrane protease YdiL (CAAX protease family)